MKKEARWAPKGPATLGLAILLVHAARAGFSYTRRGPLGPDGARHAGLAILLVHAVRAGFRYTSRASGPGWV